MSTRADNPTSGTYAETDLATTIERLSGRSLDALTESQRTQFDQFHAGGPEAVERLVPHLALTPAMTVLDVGSGFGGPARQVARATGCRVVGVDITPAFVEAAQALTRSAGPGELVRFVAGDIRSVEAEAFDAAYVMHVQMNVADKHTFFADIVSRLRPGGRLAVFEVCRSGDAQPSLPLPWSRDGRDSHLVAPDALRSAIEAAGFDLVEWVDETAWVREWFAGTAARMAAGEGTPAVLPALLHDGPTRMLNYAAAIVDGVVSIHRAAFTKPA